MNQKSNNLFGEDFSVAPINLDFSSTEVKELIEKAYDEQKEILDKKVVTDEVLNMIFTV